MYVTLLTDVKGLGKNTERIRVSDAYARNVIIPRHLGLVGEQSSFQISKQTSSLVIPPEAIREKLLLGLHFIREANDKGGLYEKLTEKQCLKDVAHLLGVPEHRIKLQDYLPIHKVGTHSVHILFEAKVFELVVTMQSK